MLLLSVASSGFMLGVKLAKVTLLKAMFEEETKQNTKISRVTGLGVGAEDLVHWLRSIPELHAYINTIKEQGTTSTDLMQVESDEPLIALGMRSEVARKCLLLQLARVRARANEISEHRADGARAGLIFEPVPPNSTEQDTARLRQPYAGSVEMQERPTCTVPTIVNRGVC